MRLALEEQRRRLEAEYAALERGRAGNEGQEVPPLARITIDNMVDIVQRQRRCVEDVYKRQIICSRPARGVF